MFKVLAKRLYGKLFADKGYISQKLFDFLFEDGIQLVTGLRVNMKKQADAVRTYSQIYCLIFLLILKSHPHILEVDNKFPVRHQRG